jgi:predicted phosphodiesterase
MRLLAFSDVVRWVGFEELVDRVNPDVVVLAGDLVSDGFSWIYSEEFFGQIPQFKMEMEQLRRKYTRREGNRTIVDLTAEEVSLLRKKYMNTQEYLHLKNVKHVNRFYSFLHYTGAKCRVLVVKGDHDDDFKGDYDVEKINSIPGCAEISARLIELNGVRFLGISAEDAYSLRRLLKLYGCFRGQVDIAVMHGKNVKAVSMIMPRLIIKGGLSTGKCRVNGIPTVFTGPNTFSIVEFDCHEVQKVLQFKLSINMGRLQPRPINMRTLYLRCYPWVSSW